MVQPVYALLITVVLLHFKKPIRLRAEEIEKFY